MNAFEKLPTFVINLSERVDRRHHILNQFTDKPEFDIELVPAIRNKVGAVGLWQSIITIVHRVIENPSIDTILICEDDHEFTNDYNKEVLFKSILDASRFNTEIIFGGIGFVDHIVQVGEYLYWIDKAWCTQFIVIFRDAFRPIIEANFTEKDVADEFLCKLLPNKLAIWPFISRQKEFGYTDVTKTNKPGTLTRLFHETDLKFRLYNETAKKLRNLNCNI